MKVEAGPDQTKRSSLVLSQCVPLAPSGKCGRFFKSCLICITTYPY